MTENKESKEDTIHKLSNLSWQRKLNERNSFPKCVNSESDQFWRAVAKPNPDQRYSNEIVKQPRQNQTLAFKSKNEFMPASKQSRDDYHFIKLEGNENDNEMKTLIAVRETSGDQKRDHQLKNRNSYGQNFRKDEKENVNNHKNIHRPNPGNQIQKYYHKRSDKNRNYRNTKNESWIPASNENDNFVRRDQRNSMPQQSWNNNNQNRTYHRSEAKNRNQKYVPRYQNFHQNDHSAEQSQQTLGLYTGTSENSFPRVSSNYSESATGIIQENPTSAEIHYQRTFSLRMKNNNYNANVTGNQATKPAFDEKFIPQTEFAQLDSSFGNAPPNVNNIYPGESNDVVENQFINFSNAGNFSTDLFSNHFTAGISEPIPTNIYQNDKFQTNVQMNQSSNIPMETINYMDNYIPSNQPLLSNNFNEPSSYSNQMFPNMLVNNDQRQFVDEFASSDKIPVTFSSLSPDVPAFVPEKHRIQSANRVAYSNLVENLRQEEELETRNVFSFSTPNNSQSQNTSWLSQNSSFISDCNESMISENEGFQSFVDVPMTFNQNNSGHGPNDIPKQQPIAVRSVPNNTSSGQTFNFNGRIINFSDESNPSSGNRRMVNLPGENTQINVIERPPTNDAAHNFYQYEEDSIGNCSYDLNNYSDVNDYSENLGFNNQQISNILQIANLNLNEAARVSTPSNQRINDFIQLSNSNANENITRQTNASILSQTILNNNSSAHQSVCGVMQNARANTMRDYYREPIADAANHLKSEEMNSKLEMVAQQLFNVNKYVTGAEMSGETMPVKDSVGQSNSEQFHLATLNRNRNELEKYRHCRNFPNEGGLGSSLSSGNSENRFDNLYTPTSVATCKSYDGSTYDRNPNTSTPNRQTSLKSEITRNPNHDRKTFHNQARMTNNKPADNYMYRNVQDDCFINFNRRNNQADSTYPKFNVTVGKPPSMGILKKPPNPVLDASIQFQKSPKDRNSGDLFLSSKDTSPLNKRVSFLLGSDQ